MKPIRPAREVAPPGTLCYGTPRFSWHSRARHRSPRDCKSQPDFKGLAPVIGGACACGITERTVEVAGEQTHLSGMAGRYATALFELALEQDAVDPVRADLDRFDALVAGNQSFAWIPRNTPPTNPGLYSNETSLDSGS